MVAASRPCASQITLSAMMSPSADPNRERPIVLAMDDDPDMLLLYEAVLDGLPCDLITASNGRDGLLRVVEYRPDLVIIDIDMPIVGGLEVLRRLRTHSKTRELPIIVVSGMSRDLRQQLAQLGIGADAYFDKPFKGPRLQREVAKLLSLESHLNDSLHGDTGMKDFNQAFSGYEMIDVLRTDNLSTTWRALQKSLNRYVSLKILTEEASRRPDVSRALAHHARTLGRLKHPNVFRLFDHGRTEFFHYTVYQYIDGVPLQDLMAQQTFPYEAVLLTMRKLCSGMECLHQNSIVLYTLRPSKIVVDLSGELKIADFGLAPAGDGRLDLSQNSIEAAVQRLPYTSPEQSIDGALVDHRSDIFAAAAIAFELLTWQPCQPGVLASTINPSVSQRIDQLLIDSLATDPRLRPATITEFHQVLEEEIMAMLPAPTRRRLEDIDFSPLRQMVRNVRPSNDIADR